MSDTPGSPYADVAVHWLDLAVPVDESALDGEERARAARFRFERDRLRFTRRRAHLRRLLSEVTGRPAPDLRYALDDHGRPRLPDHPGLRFSTSSSDELGVVAISGLELGVDVELVRPDDADRDVARRMFAAEEVAALESGPPSEHAVRFFGCWTRKEAYVKALGLGLTFPLDSFAVEVHDTPRPRLLRSTLRPADVDTARLAALAPPVDGAVAALVVLP